MKEGIQEPHLADRGRCVRAAISCGGKYLLGRRAHGDSQPGRYELLGGGQAEGEGREAALRREIEEEAGIVLNGTIGEPRLGLRFTSSRSGRRLLAYIYSLELARRPRVRLNPAEHDDLMWLTPGEALATLPLTGITYVGLAHLSRPAGIWLLADPKAVPLHSLDALRRAMFDLGAAEPVRRPAAPGPRGDGSGVAR